MFFFCFCLQLVVVVALCSHLPSRHSCVPSSSCNCNCVRVSLLLFALLDDDNLANELLDWQRDWAKSQRHCVSCWLTKKTNKQIQSQQQQFHLSCRRIFNVFILRIFCVLFVFFCAFLFCLTRLWRWTTQKFQKEPQKNLSWRSA